MEEVETEDLVNPNYMEDALAAVEEEETEQAELEEALSDEGDDDLVLPKTTFFDEDAEASQSSEADPADTDAEVSPTGTLYSYRANGEDYEVDFSTEEGRQAALKALSKGKGADRAFSELAKYKKKIKELESISPEYQKLKETWEGLNAYRDDHKKLFEVLSGEKFDEYFSKELERRNRYETASEEERKLMDMQDRMDQLEKLETRRQAEIQRKEEEFTRKAAQVEQDSLQSKIVPTFQKYAQFEGIDSQTKKTLQETLWFSAMKKLEQWDDEYDISQPKVIEHAFKSVAKAISGQAKRVAETETKKMVETKKQKAAEQAQIASQRNYPKKKELDINELSKLDPVQLYNRMFR